MKDKILVETKKIFNPEFINRIDEIIVFHSLSDDNLKEIVQLLLDECTENLKSRKLTMEFSEEAREFLIKVGYDPAYGARPLRRAVQQHVEDPLSEKILRGNIPDGSTVLVKSDTKGEKLRFIVKGSPKPLEVPDHQLKS
jgi:ATP-dependent Clp protease ATP-binding subunit ClpC